jgi:hypothetical protein
LCMDAMDMNKCSMLRTAIDPTIKLRGMVPMNTMQHDECYHALDQILWHNNQAGFVIRTIHCNREFRGMMEKVKDDLDVDMNFTNAQDHVQDQSKTIKQSRKGSKPHIITFHRRQSQGS